MQRPDFSKMTVEQFAKWSERERLRIAAECAGKKPLTLAQFVSKVRAAH